MNDKRLLVVVGFVIPIAVVKPWVVEEVMLESKVDCDARVDRVNCTVVTEAAVFDEEGAIYWLIGITGDLVG